MKPPRDIAGTLSAGVSSGLRRSRTGFVYNAGFEKGRMSDMGSRFPAVLAKLP